MAIMGKRGPRTGMKYRKRILIPCILPVTTDRQLRQAQSFNDRLDAILAEWESANAYPMNALESSLREQAVDAVALLQHSIIEGISGYMGVGGVSRTASTEAVNATNAATTGKTLSIEDDENAGVASTSSYVRGTL